MVVVSKPCQDRFLHPILVHYRKNKKIQVAKWGKLNFFFNFNCIIRVPSIPLKVSPELFSYSFRLSAIFQLSFGKSIQEFVSLLPIRNFHPFRSSLIGRGKGRNILRKPRLSPDVEVGELRYRPPTENLTNTVLYPFEK
jgi:hypothetical protein